MGQKLGTAWSDFTKLTKLWNHSSTSVPRKCHIFQSVIGSRLLYGLNSVWLNAADVRRLNGFQARCLRKILRIQPSFYSRISNRTVLQRAGQGTFSTHLLKQQLVLFGRVARADCGDRLRRLTFSSRALWPLGDTYIRKQGRPKNEWTKMVYKKASRIVGQTHNLEEVVCNEATWRHGG